MSSLHDQLYQIEQSLGVCHIADVQPWHARQQSQPRGTVFGVDGNVSDTEDVQPMDAATVRCAAPNGSFRGKDVLWPQSDGGRRCPLPPSDRGHSVKLKLDTERARWRDAHDGGRLPQQLVEMRAGLDRLTCQSVELLRLVGRPEKYQTPGMDLHSVTATHEQIIQDAKRLVASGSRSPKC